MFFFQRYSDAEECEVNCGWWLSEDGTREIDVIGDGDAPLPHTIDFYNNGGANLSFD